jgi:hypothetical protein
MTVTNGFPWDAGKIKTTEQDELVELSKTTCGHRQEKEDVI